MDTPQVLALDIGGTKLASAVVGPTGAVAAAQRTATPKQADPEVLFSALVALANVAVAQWRATGGVGELHAIGVGCGRRTPSPALPSLLHRLAGPVHRLVPKV